jgi:hypothetical protein
MSLEQQAQHVVSFQEQAQALMEGLSDMQTLLEEKEFQLWEKEGLLEYQEERLMNSEDLELEMANYINEMAQTLRDKNASLPAGLEEKPYYGSQLANVDDDPANGEYGERRRQLGAFGESARGKLGGATKHAKAIRSSTQLLPDEVSKEALANRVPQAKKTGQGLKGATTTGALREKFLAAAGK